MPAKEVHKFKLKEVCRAKKKTSNSWYFPYSSLWEREKVLENASYRKKLTFAEHRFFRRLFLFLPRFHYHKTFQLSQKKIPIYAWFSNRKNKQKSRSNGLILCVWLLLFVLFSRLLRNFPQINHRLFSLNFETNIVNTRFSNQSHVLHAKGLAWKLNKEHELA